MSAPSVRPFRRRRARRPQLGARTPLVALAAARQVVEEVTLWLGLTLHGRYAVRLAFQARRIYAHSESFRSKLQRPGNRGRDTLYAFMRHWLAARLQAERPDLFARLPRDYAAGAELPAATPGGFAPQPPAGPAAADCPRPEQALAPAGTLLQHLGFPP